MKKINISDRKMKQIITIVLILIGCFGLGYFVTDVIISYFDWDIHWSFKLLRTMEMIAILVVVYFFQVILHEVGHMVAAWLQGWKFLSFLLFRWMFTYTDGKWHCYKMTIPGAAGGCMMMPPEEGNTQKSLIRYCAGGLVANAILVLLAILNLIFIFPDAIFETRVFWWMMIVSGVFILFLNGLPSNMFSLPNDGLYIKTLRHHPESVSLFVECLRTPGRMQEGKLPVDFRHGYFFDLTKEKPDFNNPIHEQALLQDVQLAMNKFDFEKAKEFLQFIEIKKRYLHPLIWKQFRMDILYLYFIQGVECPESIWDYDLDQAINKMAAYEPMAMRAKYMIAKFNDHDLEESEEIYKQFIHLCDNYPISGEAEYNRRLVDFARLKQ